MPKFRKKSVAIEAVRYMGNGNIEPRGPVPAWLWDAFKEGRCRSTDGGDPLVIRTLVGDMTVAPGDWIVRGVNSDLYPFKPDVFEKTYEPVEESAQ